MSHTSNHFDQFFRRLGRRRFVKGTFRILRYLFLFLFLFAIVSWFLLQNGKVQNYLLNEVTEYLSEELETTVTAQHLDYDFFNKLVLEGLYIEDHHGDTLLYSQELKASFDLNLLKVIQKKYDIRDVYLTNARFKIFRDSAQQFSNLDLLLNKLATDKKPTSNKKGRPALLSLNNLYLDNITYVQDDRVAGKKLIAFLDQGAIAVNNIDLKKSDFSFGQINLKSPNFVLIEKKAFPFVSTQSVEGNPPPKSSQDSPPLEEKPSTYQFSIEGIALSNGRFTRQNLRDSSTPDLIEDHVDFNHLGLSDIQLDVRNLIINKEGMEASIKNLSADENSGFVLSKLSVEKAKLSDRKISLLGLDLKTPYSHINEKVVFSFRSFEDFKNFQDKVLIQTKFNDSQIAVRDILAFAQKLNTNEFFAKNADQVVEIDGEIQGRINSLKGKDLTIKLGNTTKIEGSFT